MTREERQLLLKDLCARLPYGVKCYFEKDGGKSPIHTVTIGLFADVANRDDVICKPYLRPMSSMTEEEREEYGKACELDTDLIINHFMSEEPFPALYNSQDWLNSHHFDYRGLIEKGLALEAPKDMYKEE